jgi:hypothetical protein
MVPHRFPRCWAGIVASVRRRAEPVNSTARPSRHDQFSQLTTVELLAARSPAPRVNTGPAQPTIEQITNKSLQLYFKNLVY